MRNYVLLLRANLNLRCRDWTNATGAGVENQEDFWAYVLKKMCPFYKELEPIMGERPNAQALLTNEDDGGDTSSDSGFGDSGFGDSDDDSVQCFKIGISWAVSDK